MTGTLTVGVLGGMGPDATLDYFAKLLDASPAKDDQDRLRILIDNNPKLPNRNRAVAGEGPSPGPDLGRMAAGLASLGADFLVMPCNTAHAFAADIERAVEIPLVSIIDVTVNATKAAMPAGATRVGVLAAAGTLQAGLYREAFAREGVEALQLDESGLARFMDLLYRIKSGARGEAAKREMQELAGELLDAGAAVLVAGCTEVPLVLQAADVPVPLVNSTDELVRVTVQLATGERPLPTGESVIG